MVSTLKIPTAQIKAAGDIATFLWQSLWNEKPWPKAVDNAPADPLVARVTEGIRITYINHATVLIQTAGLNILTDPVWSTARQPGVICGAQTRPCARRANRGPTGD